MRDFSKILELVRQTGDRLVVWDERAVRAFVIVAIEEYERMRTGDQGIQNLTEGEFLNKINRDIAAWRESQESDSDVSFFSEIPREAVPESPESAQEPEEEGTGEQEDRYYIEPVS